MCMGMGICILLCIWCVSGVYLVCMGCVLVFVWVLVWGLVSVWVCVWLCVWVSLLVWVWVLVLVFVWISVLWVWVWLWVWVFVFCCVSGMYSNWHEWGKCQFVTVPW